MAIPLEPIPNSPAGDERTTIICLYCSQSQPVARKALNVVCKYCHKSLRLEDLPIKDYQARRSVETCGVVTVEKKGQIVADRVLCGGMVIRGKVKATITSRGPVLVGPDAEIKGDVLAPTLAVGAGAILEGQYRIGYAENPQPQ
ncbi:MAG: polymer-forming cytoskeletal protein [Tepidisphaeraceae bacterium]